MPKIIDTLRTRRGLLPLICLLFAFSLAIGGCGDDKKDAASDAAVGPTGKAGKVDGQSFGEETDSDGSDSGSGASSSGSGSGGSGSGGSGSGGSDSGGSDSDSKSKSKSKSGSGGDGEVITDNNAVDGAETDSTPKKITAEEKSGLGKALGQADGAVNEYIRDPLRRGWFKQDSSRQKGAISTAELAAPYVIGKLMLASGSVSTSENEVLRRELTSAYAAFVALRSIPERNAARRVAISLGAFDSAMRTARKAGVNIKTEIPSRTELR